MDDNIKAIYDDLSRQITEKEVIVAEIRNQIVAESDETKTAKLEEREKALNAQILEDKKARTALIGNFYFYFILFYFILFISFDFCYLANLIMHN